MSAVPQKWTFATTYFAVDARRAEVIPRPSGFSGFFVKLGGGRTFWNFAAARGPIGAPPARRDFGTILAHFWRIARSSMEYGPGVLSQRGGELNRAIARIDLAQLSKVARKTGCHAGTSWQSVRLGGHWPRVANCRLGLPDMERWQRRPSLFWTASRCCSFFHRAGASLRPCWQAI